MAAPKRKNNKNFKKFTQQRKLTKFGNFILKNNDSGIYIKVKLPIRTTN